MDKARSFERPGALAGGARRQPAAAAPATASGARTPGWPEPRQIMLEISEDQNLDLNSDARQRLLALEQLSSPWSWMMTAPTTTVSSGITPP